MEIEDDGSKMLDFSIFFFIFILIKYSWTGILLEIHRGVQHNE